jgi:4-amino-4-deoxy-L-arabinose transferase-like glycosyltransferase
MKARLLPQGIALPLVLILGAYLLIAVSYSVVTPLFEAPDEQWHYFTAQHIAETGRLPVVEEEYDEWMGQEAAQPPLYYLVGAILISPIDTSNAREEVWLNPYAWIGSADAVANINRMVHTPVEAWPWQGYALAAHLLRGFSAVLGLATLLFVHGSAALLWPSDPRRAYLATAFVAFLPQFGFIHGAVSNDSLIIMLSSAAIWQLMRIWTTHADQTRLLSLGVTIGLAALTKNTGLLLLIYAGFVLILMAIRDREKSLVSKALLFVFVPSLLIAGWLFWRNWTLYGDFTATNQFVRIAGGDREYSLLQVLGESSGLWTSLIAVFGWFNVRVPEWIYLAWNFTVALAFAGGIRTVYRTVRRPEMHDATPSRRLTPGTLLLQPHFTMILLLLWFLLVYAGLVYFMLQTEAAQGRLLLPAVVPMALLLVSGLSQLKSSLVYWVGPLMALATTLYSVFLVIRPTYSPPAELSELPADIVIIDQEMGKGLRLVGANLETTTAHPGELVYFTLYWRADAIPEEPPEFVLELFGRDLDRVGNLHSYHGRGLYPATLWAKGTIIEDRFSIRLQEEMQGPVLAWAQARLDGEQATANVGTVKVTPLDWPPAPVSIEAEIGEGVGLSDVSLSHASLRPGDTLSVTLTWLVSSAPGVNLTTIVHLGQAGIPPIATGDSPPLSGSYPTSVWADGEVIRDHYRLAVPDNLPQGRFPVWIGMYDSEMPEVRLPLVQNGVRQPGDLYLAGQVEIVD